MPCCTYKFYSSIHIILLPMCQLLLWGGLQWCWLCPLKQQWHPVLPQEWKLHDYRHNDSCKIAISMASALESLQVPCTRFLIALCCFLKPSSTGKSSQITTKVLTTSSETLLAKYLRKVWAPKNCLVLWQKAQARISHLPHQEMLPERKPDFKIFKNATCPSRTYGSGSCKNVLLVSHAASVSANKRKSASAWRRAALVYHGISRKLTVTVLFISFAPRGCCIFLSTIHMYSSCVRRCVIML